MVQNWICLGSPRSSILKNNSRLAMHPMTMATAVRQATHLGCFSDCCPPPGSGLILQPSVHPDRAMSVRMGPSAPQISGVILAQDNSHAGFPFCCCAVESGELGAASVDGDLLEFVPSPGTPATLRGAGRGADLGPGLSISARQTLGLHLDQTVAWGWRERISMFG